MKSLHVGHGPNLAPLPPDSRSKVSLHRSLQCCSRPAPARSAQGLGILFLSLIFLAIMACDKAPEVSSTLEELPNQQARLAPKELRYKLDRLDPTRDGWQSEAVTDVVSKRLKELADLLATAGDLTPQTLAPLTVDGATSTALLPADLALAFDGQMQVERRTEANADDRADMELIDALRQLIAPFSVIDRQRLEFKQVGIQIDGASADIELRVHIAGTSAKGRLQQNAVWQTNWTLSNLPTPSTSEESATTESATTESATTEAAPQDSPSIEARLALIRGRSFEQITLPTPEPLFDDVTASVFGETSSFNNQLIYGKRHWGARIDASQGADILGHHGVSVADINGDGREDVYVNQGGGLPNRLFLQRPDGTVEDHSAAAGVDYLNWSPSSLFLDFDNDGDQDLAVAIGQLVLHSNDGTGHFTVETVVPTSTIMSMVAADYDNDGDLDIYVCRYSSPENSAPQPFQDANNGQRNALLRNDGDFTFTDVTDSVGLDQNNLRFSFAAAWEDYDDDGDQDLYVANDFGRNNLYRNDDGQFVDVAAELGVEDISTGMSVAWSDFDRDGRMDLYVGNMFSSAGYRTTYQRQFQNDPSGDVRSSFQRLARGNSLFRAAAQPDQSFEDLSLESGADMGRWSWSSKFADLDNDGWQDLVVANGYVSNDITDDL